MIYWLEIKNKDRIINLHNKTLNDRQFCFYKLILTKSPFVHSFLY